MSWRGCFTFVVVLTVWVVVARKGDFARRRASMAPPTYLTHSPKFARRRPLSFTQMCGPEDSKLKDFGTIEDHPPENGLWQQGAFVHPSG